jgi:hypothetical protein
LPVEVPETTVFGSSLRPNSDRIEPAAYEVEGSWVFGTKFDCWSNCEAVPLSSSSPLRSVVLVAPQVLHDRHRDYCSLRLKSFVRDAIFHQ